MIIEISFFPLFFFFLSYGGLYRIEIEHNCGLCRHCAVN